MKKVIFTILGCFSILKCCANELHETNERLYVPPGSVFVASDAIYVNVNGNFFSVEMVGIDENGIFVSHETGRGDTAYCIVCGQEYNRRKGHNCPGRR